MTLRSGKYLLEVWGAQGGGDVSRTIGGAGGYSKGTINLSATTLIYIYVGGQGISATGTQTVNGGFNGGGKAYTGSSNTGIVGSGGGASDIRINSDSLYSGVIVSGGGGGAGRWGNSYDTKGGFGGGLTGGNGISYSTSSHNVGNGASQA